MNTYNNNNDLNFNVNIQDNNTSNAKPNLNPPGFSCRAYNII